MTLPEFGIPGEHAQEFAISRAQVLRLVMPMSEQRTARVQWWLLAQNAAEPLRFQVVTPENVLLDHGGLGVLNLGAFAVASSGGYALLLENHKRHARSAYRDGR
jgi:hypothetical protein